MSDLNWCTFCDTAISPYSTSLYCSEQCLRSDALQNHPLLGYDWKEFVDFPRPYPGRQNTVASQSALPWATRSVSPAKQHTHTPSQPFASSSIPSVLPSQASVAPSPLISPALSVSSSPSSSSISSSLGSTTSFSCPNLELSRSKTVKSVRLSSFLMTPIISQGIHQN